MYEKNADIMDSLRNAKNSVADGAMSLLQKIRGSSANDGVSALPPEAQQAIGEGVASLPESARKTVDSLRGQPMENLAEKATKLLGEGGRKLKDSAASGLAYVPGVGGSLDGFFNPIPGRGRLVSAMGEGQMASRFGASSGLLGGVGGATVGTAGALLALLLSKGKLNPRASLALGLGGPLGGAAAGGLVGNSIGTHAGANLFREMAAKEGSWADAPSFSANMPMPLHKKEPSKYLTGKPPSAKADTAGATDALRKLGSQDNCSPSRSAAGDSKGVKYKLQNEDHATGTAAFDSLDKYLRMAKKAALESSDKKKKKIKWYGITLPEDQKRIAEEKYYEMNSQDDNKNKAMAMAMDKYKEMSKKAGLNDFQTNFFGRLIQEGINEHEMYEAIKQAGDQFGYKVGKELNRGLEKLSNWGALGKGLMTGAKYLGAGALGAGAGVAASGAVQQGVKDGVQQGVKDGVQQGVQNVGNNAINSAGNFMNNAANSAGNFMNNAMGNPSQNGENMHRVRSNIPEPTGNQYQAVRSNIPETGGNPFQNMADIGMSHFKNMANGAMGMLGTGMRGGAAANGTGQQNSGFNPLQYMPGAGGAFGGANKVPGLGGGFTGNGMGKQSREKKAVNWVGAARAAANYLGTNLARPGAAVKSVYDAARGAKGTIGKGIQGVLADKTLRGQALTGAGTGAFNPFTGAFTPSDDPNAGWGDYAARVGGSALAGAGAGLLGGAGTQSLMQRMNSGMGAGLIGDMGAGAFGYDTGGMGAKGGFLGAGLLPSQASRLFGDKAVRAMGFSPGIPGMTGPMQGATTTDVITKYNPMNMLGRAIGKGYTKNVAPLVRPTFDKAMAGMKANKPLTAGVGLGVAGIGTGAYIGNKAVNGINDASERMNAQMNMLRNETHNNLSGIRQDLGGGMGGIGQFFEENKHWLMPALLAGGGALAGGALGGQSGAAMGGLSLPALYMMHQNGMFGGGGGAANPLHAPPAKADYAQRKQQHEQELVDDYIARRNQDPRLASPTAPPSKPYAGTGVMPNMPPKPNSSVGGGGLINPNKMAGDRAVRLMRHFAKN